METLSLEKRQLCDIQVRLFELALKNEYDCPLFIENFMASILLMLRWPLIT